MKLRILLPLLALALVVGCNIEFPAQVEFTPTGRGIEPIAVNDDNFAEVVLASDRPVLVDFSAKWCGYCEEMEPTVAEVAAEFEGRALVCKLDADESPRVTERYEVTGFPTFMFFQNGVVAEKFIGTQAKGGLTEQLEAMLAVGAE